MKKTLLAATIITTALSANASDVVQATYTPEPVNKALIIAPLEESLAESRKALEIEIALTLASLKQNTLKSEKPKKYKVTFIEAD